MKLRATSFATDQDLVAYRKCLDSGHSDSYCTSHAGGGDNGEGAWGDDTTSRTHAYCALGPTLQKKHQSLNVTLYAKGTTDRMGNTFRCIQGDRGNEGIIDLNPGALLAAGLNPNLELDADAVVVFID
jgi:hypothetical protein